MGVQTFQSNKTKLMRGGLLSAIFLLTIKFMKCLQINFAKTIAKEKKVW